MTEEITVFPHHRKVGPCYNRPPYRDGRRKRAVKIFTIADESMYLLIFGVPSIDLANALQERIRRISPVEQIRKVSHPESVEFTETYLAKFDSVNSSRNVKRRLDDSSFYGGFLHLAYAPEYESVAECRIKMHSYRRFNEAVERKSIATGKYQVEEHRNPSDAGKVEVNPNACATNLSNSPFSLKEEPPPGLMIASVRDVLSVVNPYSVFVHGFSPSQNVRPCDAVDDARQYWVSKGFNFTDTPLHRLGQSEQPDQNPLPIRRTPISRSGHALINQSSLSAVELEEYSLSEWSHLPRSMTSGSVSVSKDLTKFIPRMLQTPQPLINTSLPPIKRKK